ncbi:flagellar motor protein MotB [Hydrogenophaga sp.]|uniref:flagellar motor protein MotB n=1 Tax=Hydrogenophaga sp. TaxID=1904254 RepID=UPI003F6BACA2
MPPIIVKRVKKASHENHGGVWKIAYADFVTAMMAFFLLMWVLGSTTSGDLAGISAYFQNPLRVAINGGAGSGDAARIIKGGGDNIFKQDGQEARADSNTPQRKVSNEEEVTAQFNRMQQEKLEQLQRALDKQIASDASLDRFKNQIFMDITSEGLRIQIVDENSRPMFASGSAQMSPQSQQLLTTIGRVLKGLPNKLRIEGHTDSKPFGGSAADYGNWELSSDRAHAARRAVVGGGVEPNQISLVAGFADSVQLNPADANDPLNRRISLLVLKQAPQRAQSPEAAPPTQRPANTLGETSLAPLPATEVAPPLAAPTAALPATPQPATPASVPSALPAVPLPLVPTATSAPARASGGVRGQALVLPDQR